MIDRWAHLGHVLGECWYDQNLAYINIPKNATSTVKGYLIAENWQTSSQPVDCGEYFTVLRDPIERWISGIAQYQINSEQLELTEEEIFDTVTFDDHTETQSYFLAPFDMTKTVYFKCDNTLRSKLEHYLTGHGYEVTRYYFDDRNVSHGVHAKCKQQIVKMLQADPKNLNKVMAHFAVDYQLMTSIKYYYD